MKSAGRAIGSRKPGVLRHVPDLLKFLFFAAGMILLLISGTRTLEYHWQWYRVPRYLFRITEEGFTSGPLLDGLLVTFQITGVSLFLAFSLGLVAVLFRLSNSFSARALARAYLELIRNTPLLIQLFFLYFVISPIVGMNAFSSAVLALSLFEGAYISEIFRAGILSVPKGQWEAAYSSGLNSFEVYRFVVLPQAVRNIIPPLTSQAISLIKDSALVSTIAIYDLTMRGQAIVAETFLAFEIWFTVAAIYLAITISLSALVSVLENRFRNEPVWGG
ncbi:MAG: amino acid ABC transporter permease [Desulfomonilia bacterium]|nr:amino acid ABC transporter permease [Desulfomonilia bacterium]